MPSHPSTEPRRQLNTRNPSPLQPRWLNQEYLHHHPTHGQATDQAAHQRGSPTRHRTQRLPPSPPTPTQPTHNNPWEAKTATRRDILRPLGLPSTPIKATHPPHGTPQWNRNQTWQTRSQQYPDPPPITSSPQAQTRMLWIYLDTLQGLSPHGPTSPRLLTRRRPTYLSKH